MAVHVIPVTEKDLHKESPDCQCEPELKLDNESGEMVWVHELIAPERLIENIMQL